MSTCGTFLLRFLAKRRALATGLQLAMVLPWMPPTSGAAIAQDPTRGELKGRLLAAYAGSIDGWALIGDAQLSLTPRVSVAFSAQRWDPSFLCTAVCGPDGWTFQTGVRGRIPLGNLFAIGHVEAGLHRFSETPQTGQTTPAFGVRVGLGLPLIKDRLDCEVGWKAQHIGSHDVDDAGFDLPTCTFSAVLVGAAMKIG